MSMIDSNAVNVAIPPIMNAFHSSLSSTQWVISGYLLALGTFLVTSAYFSKRFGAERVYFASLIGFTLTSGVSAASPSLEFLIIARIMQGASGALLVPLAMDMLLGKSGDRHNISPLLGVILFLAPAIGPALGGFLTQEYGWQMIFLINLPVGCVSAYIVYHNILQRRGTVQSSVTFDLLGSLLLGSGLALVLYSSSIGPLNGWESLSVFPYLVSGFCLIIVYAFRAIHVQHASVDVRILANSQHALRMVLSVISSLVLFSMMFLIPVFVESIQGFSPGTSGLILLPQGLVTGVGTVIGNRVSRTKSIRFTTVLGMAILVMATTALLTVNAGTPPWILATILSGRGLALGLTIQPLLIAILGSLPDSKVPDANTLFNILNRLGGSIGISLLSSVYELRVTSHIANASSLQVSEVMGFHDVILLLSVVSVIGLAIGMFLKKEGVQNLREIPGVQSSE